MLHAHLSNTHSSTYTHSQTGLDFMLSNLAMLIDAYIHIYVFISPVVVAIL